MYDALIALLDLIREIEDCGPISGLHEEPMPALQRDAATVILVQMAMDPTFVRNSPSRRRPHFRMPPGTKTSRRWSPMRTTTNEENAWGNASGTAEVFPV